MFLVAVINSYCQSIYVLEQGGLFLFLDRNRILDPIREPLVIAIAEYTILPTQLRGIVHKVHIVSGNLVTRLYIEIVQHIGYFTNGVQETKMSMQLVHKQVPVREPVLQDVLVFLVKAHFKPVLDYSSEIGHCEVDFHNVHVELCQVSMEIQATLEQEIIELVRLSAAESIGDTGFSSL